MSIVINDVSPRVHYTATSGQTVFQVPFAWLDNMDLKVYVNETLCFFAAPPANGLQYSTSGVGTTTGGTITFGPPGRQSLDEVVIFRDMPIERTSDLPTSGPLPVAALNDTFDAQTAMIQQTEVNVVERSLSLSDNDFTEALRKLPNKIGRRGRVLAFDFNGQPVLVTPQQLSDLTGGGGDSGLGFLGLIWTDDLPPPAPWSDGQLWWQSSTGKLFVYYDDGDSLQWVQVNMETGTVGTGPVVSGNSRIVATTLTAPSGTWLRSEGCRFYRVRGVGGGGAGGAASSSPSTFAAGSGGGSGGFGESPWIDASGVPSANYVTGAGGIAAADSAVPGGSGQPTTWNDGTRLYTWGGGGGGISLSGQTATLPRPGGIAGTISGGLLTYAGEHGGPSLATQLASLSGAGGSNPIGQGGYIGYSASTPIAGQSATRGHGGGGGGAVRGFSVFGHIQGGTGARGAIIVEEMF